MRPSVPSMLPIKLSFYPINHGQDLAMQIVHPKGQRSSNAERQSSIVSSPLCAIPDK